MYGILGIKNPATVPVSEPQGSSSSDEFISVYI